MEKMEFLTKVADTRQEFESIVAELDEAQLLKTGTCGDWSVKDVIAHVSWYERQMVEVLKSRALIGSELWGVSLEERNAAIHRENHDRPLKEILDESRQVFEELIRLLKTLSDDDLLLASRFHEMPADWIPWQVIASNTFEHYPDHTRDIQRAFPEQVK